MELALTINRHPQSAFQPVGSFHKGRLLMQLDSKLDSRTDQLNFNQQSVFDEERQEGLLNLKVFPAKRILQLYLNKEEASEKVSQEQENQSTQAASNLSSPQLVDEKVEDVPEPSESEQFEDDGRVDMAALTREVCKQTDLNRAVADLLERPLSEEENKEIKRRQRKGKEQLALLEEEY